MSAIYDICVRCTVLIVFGDVVNAVNDFKKFITTSNLVPLFAPSYNIECPAFALIRANGYLKNLLIRGSFGTSGLLIMNACHVGYPELRNLPGKPV
jgi:hypothetical protein